MNTLHVRFLAFLPKIKAHANITFRSIRYDAMRSDHVAETVALAWKWYLALESRGKDASRFVSAIATFAVRAVRSGRRVAGMGSARDVMNNCRERIQTTTSNVLCDALTDNSATPPPDAAAFRIDFPRWLDGLPDRDRQLVERLMVGDRTMAMARRFRISPARVSQLRRELCRNYSRFHGERPEPAA
jgi:hypothetical protein